MKLVKAERPPRYVGPIKECPNKEVVEAPETSREQIFRQAYTAWSEKFFEKRPRGRLTYNSFESETLVVNGTGDNGRWLVAWWLEEDNG